MKKKLKNPLVKEWFARGKADLEVAGITLRESQHYALVCFLAQQAAEKYLKGYLTVKNKKFRKTHFIAELIEIAVKSDKSFADLFMNAQHLDGYYIDTRYPVDWSRTYSEKDAQSALEDAREIIVFVKKRI